MFLIHALWLLIFGTALGMVASAGSGRDGWFSMTRLPMLKGPEQLYSGLTSSRVYFTSLTGDTTYRWCAEVDGQIRCSPYESTFLVDAAVQYLPGGLLATNGRVDGTSRTVILDENMRVVRVMPFGVVIGDATYSYVRGQTGVTRHTSRTRNDIPMQGLDGMPHDGVLELLPFRGQPVLIGKGGWIRTRTMQGPLVRTPVWDVQADRDGFVLASRSQMFIHNGPLSASNVRSVDTPGLEHFCVARDYVVYFTADRLHAVYKKTLAVKPLWKGLVQWVACNPELNSFVANFESRQGAARFDLQPQ